MKASILDEEAGSEVSDRDTERAQFLRRRRVLVKEDDVNASMDEERT